MLCFGEEREREMGKKIWRDFYFVREIELAVGIFSYDERNEEERRICCLSKESV